MGILDSFVLSSPAKINLFLHITGRRPDGYHELQTIFQILDLCDSLSFKLIKDSQEIRVECPGLDVVQSENLVYRAAKILQKTGNSAQGVSIFIEKRIPTGAGLGGGSSDAATALHGLNYLWQCGLSRVELADIGRGLGADVPVFIHGKTSWGEGIGEKLTPIELLPQHYLVLNPSCHVSSAEIFSHPDLTRDSSQSKIARFLEEGSPFDHGRNDCEAVVSALYPEVSEAILWLSKWGAARMTGTGSCIFLSIPTLEKGREILSQVPAKWSAFITKGTRTSALIEELDHLGQSLT
jgi:4-diphosphocytidyl-2-C-methyl-D-erythritol kinase